MILVSFFADCCRREAAVPKAAGGSSRHTVRSERETLTLYPHCVLTAAAAKPPCQRHGGLAAAEGGGRQQSAHSEKRA